jgi:monothiol glutaredoxin
MKESSMSDPVLDEIKKLIEGNRVALFMKGTPEMPRCGFSAGVVEVLRKHNTPFAAMDILPDPRIRQVLSSYSSWPTIPQLFIQGKLIGGCDIVREMDAKGELKPLLDAAAKS